jgi:hypothetical protein
MGVSHESLPASSTDQLKNSSATTHREPADQGGELYYRCGSCGRESIDSPNDILHRESCEVTDR